jgi:hypothetical protein
MMARVLEGRCREASMTKPPAPPLWQEPPRLKEGGAAPPPGWPASGALTYKDVWATYRPGLPPVLKALSFSLPANCSCGVVGRTGSGKSSLMLTLFRLISVDQGVITLDGLDTSKVALDVLRRQLAIIPQDPVGGRGGPWVGPLGVGLGLAPRGGWGGEGPDLREAPQRGHGVGQGPCQTPARGPGPWPGAQRQSSRSRGRPSRPHAAPCRWVRAQQGRHAPHAPRRPPLAGPVQRHAALQPGPLEPPRRRGCAPRGGGRARACGRPDGFRRLRSSHLMSGRLFTIQAATVPPHRPTLPAPPPRTDLWEVLGAVQLKPAISAAGGLSAPMAEAGDNLSVGQRQLFCLARCAGRAGWPQGAPSACRWKSKVVAPRPAPADRPPRPLGLWQACGKGALFAIPLPSSSSASWPRWAASGAGLNSSECRAPVAPSTLPPPPRVAAGPAAFGPQGAAAGRQGAGARRGHRQR